MSWEADKQFRDVREREPPPDEFQFVVFGPESHRLAHVHGMFMPVHGIMVTELVLISLIQTILIINYW